jgi:SM-20-related protein
VSDALVEAGAADRLCAAIATEGLVIVADFLSETDVAALATDARRHDAAGEFHPAGVGRNTPRAVHADIRGDRIFWLDGADAAPAVRPAWQALENVRLALNATLFLGLFAFEGHYALYPPGAHYRRHRDRFRDDDARVLSCVLYLNERWTPVDAGQLRIHFGDGGQRDVLPVGGTLVCFLSERFEHEVLPATRERLALTGWFRRRTAPA